MARINVSLHALKWLLTVINICTALAGLGLTCLGIYGLAKPVTGLSTSNVIPTIFVILGALVFLISFSGCFGAVTESRGALGVYLGTLLFLIAIQIIAVSLVFASKVKLDTKLDRAWDYAYQHHPRIIRDIQEDYSCCGFNDPMDRAFPKRFPDSCLNDPNFGFANGCRPELHSAVKDNINNLSIVAASLIAFQLLALVLGGLLAMRIPNPMEREEELREEERRLLARMNRRSDEVEDTEPGRGF